MTSPRGTFDAVILAGGAGSRLGGRDKAAVQLGGRPLIDTALDAATEARTLVVVGPTAAAVPARALRTVEAPPGSGPAAATVAGLRVIPNPADWTAVLACDLPGAAHALPRLLTARDRDGAVLLDPDGHPQWVLAVYRTSALLAAAEALGNPADRSMRSLLGGLNLVLVAPDEDDWRDVDTWEDHQAWDRRLIRSADDDTCED